MIAEVSAKRQVDEGFYATNFIRRGGHADILAQKNRRRNRLRLGD